MQSEPRTKRIIAKLHNIQLASLNRRWSQWLSFPELFTSPIHKKALLLNIEQLHYLKTIVIMRSSSCLIKQFYGSLKPIGVLSNCHAAKLIDIVVVNQKILQKRKSLLDNTREVQTFGGLDNLSAQLQIVKDIKAGNPTIQRFALGPALSYPSAVAYLCSGLRKDNLLIALLVRKLDWQTLSDWESSLGSTREPTSFNLVSLPRDPDIGSRCLCVDKQHPLEVCQTFRDMRQTGVLRKHPATNITSTTIGCCMLRIALLSKS
ncbi:hypothetical protein KM043_015790 [Ampulex compressa]|nr:hypothetical protein KM043_015790 [Ampulex compressa]